MQSALLRFRLRQLHVLDEVLQKEARRVIPRQNLGAEGIQLLAARRTGGHGPQQRLQVQALGPGVGQRLAHAGEGPGDHDLVRHFGVLAAPRLSLVIQVGSHGLE